MIWIALVFAVTMPFSFAEENLIPLDIKMRVWPEEIHYGDACFLIFSVTNPGPETLYLPYGEKFLGWMPGRLNYGEKEVLLLENFDVFNDSEGVMAKLNRKPPWYPGHPVKPGETMDFHTRMVWIPLPEFAHREQAQELLHLVDKGEKNYRIQFEVNYSMAYLMTVRPRYDKNMRLLSREDFPADALDIWELEAKGYKIAPSRGRQECFIRILPRPQEEFQLLHEWYLELPTTASSGEWTMQFVFAHPFHVNGSPYKMEAPTLESLAGIEQTNEPATEILEGVQEPDTRSPQFVKPLNYFHNAGNPETEKAMFTNMDAPSSQVLEQMRSRELGKMREPFTEAYFAFFASMETRTPELLARIERTNELAAKIIERSKEPNSTFSQNMVEFIQLRGFLVDMRYAENPETEEAAFVKMMDFINASQDKELWVPFMHEIGLCSIENFTHFPRQKVEQYRDRFAERFQIERKGLLN